MGLEAVREILSKVVDAISCRSNGAVKGDPCLLRCELKSTAQPRDRHADAVEPAGAGRHALLGLVFCCPRILGPQLRVWALWAAAWVGSSKPSVSSPKGLGPSPLPSVNASCGEQLFAEGPKACR